MNELLGLFGGWTWWILACVLLIVELLAPAVLFMWLAGAAATVGLIELVYDMPWQAEIAIFSVLSVIFVIIGRPWVLKRRHVESDQPNLNKRINQFVGQQHILVSPIVHGRGQIRIDDTLWDVIGPDMAKDSWVKVTGVDGLRLEVIAGDKS